MTTSTRNLREDYLSGAAPLRPFYEHSPTDPDFEAIAEAKLSEDIDRQLLARVIREQYEAEGLDPGDAVTRNLDRLAHPQSLTITTGHQLVLYGGPLFTVYKILSVIRLAEDLSARWADRPVLPIFWIHTEDHDFEEINHYFLSYTDKRTYTGAFRTMVGAHVLTEDIEAVRPAALSAALQQAYLPGRSMRAAFRCFIHELFREYGLLILDAADARLKARFEPVAWQDLQQQMARDSVNHTSAAMSQAGYKNQIHPREINLFYLDEQGRDRIVEENGHYKPLGRDTAWSAEELRQLLQAHPERFSPNVSLRPLYQEMILPNLAYIGGWGELSYWLQLRDLFERAGVHFPLLLPRMSGTVVPASHAARWAQLGFTPPDIRQPLHQLYDRYLPQVWDPAGFDQHVSNILESLQSLHQYVEGEISPTLARSADALHTKNQQFLSNLKKKAGKVMRHRHPEAFRSIAQIKAELQPDGVVQERVFSLATIAQWMEPKAFVRFLYERCQPMDLDHQIWILPEA